MVLGLQNGSVDTALFTTTLPIECAIEPKLISFMSIPLSTALSASSGKAKSELSNN